MHEALQKEIATYEKRTPKSAAAPNALQRIPLGVRSNYRHYEPYPIFVKDGKAGRIHDVDGNEYVDHNLCFGALMAGIASRGREAVEQKLHEGTTFGMPHDAGMGLAEEICARYPVDMVTVRSSGTEVTMHAVRIAPRRGRARQDSQVRKAPTTDCMTRRSSASNPKRRLGRCRGPQFGARGAAAFQKLPRNASRCFNNLGSVGGVSAKIPADCAIISSHLDERRLVHAAAWILARLARHLQ